MMSQTPQEVAEIHYAQAKGLHSRQKFVEALEEIDKCLEHCPGDPKYMNYKGILLYIDHGDQDGVALTHLEKLVPEDHPEYTFFLRHRALILINAHQKNDEAVGDLMHVLAIDPFDEAAQRMLDELDDGITIPHLVP